MVTEFKVRGERRGPLTKASIENEKGCFKWLLLLLILDGDSLPLLSMAVVVLLVAVEVVVAAGLARR